MNDIGFLNFNDCNTEKDAFNRMKSIADKILYDYQLEFFDHTWEITAIEFYLDIPTNRDGFSFQDPFIHMNKQQLIAGSFYVHDDCTRACNYSGIDIACGTLGETNIHGGILIRELNRNDGSATALKSIIRKVELCPYLKTDKWTQDEKAMLFNIHRKNVFEGPLKLVSKQKTSNSLDIYYGKRNLSISPKDALMRSLSEQEFIEKKMRFASWETKKHVKTMTLFK